MSTMPACSLFYFFLFFYFPIIPKVARRVITFFPLPYPTSGRIPPSLSINRHVYITRPHFQNADYAMLVKDALIAISRCGVSLVPLSNQSKTRRDRWKSFWRSLPLSPSSLFPLLTIALCWLLMLPSETRAKRRRRHQKQGSILPSPRIKASGIADMRCFVKEILAIVLFLFNYSFLVSLCHFLRMVVRFVIRPFRREDINRGYKQGSNRSTTNSTAKPCLSETGNRAVERE